MNYTIKRKLEAITFVISKNKVLRNQHKQEVKDIVVQSQAIWRFLKK